MSLLIRRAIAISGLAAFLILIAGSMTAALAQGSQSQTIQFLPVADQTVSAAPFQVVAIASSNLPVTLALTGPATLDDQRLITLTGVPGTVTIQATQPGNTVYAAAPMATLSFNVALTPVALTFPPASITYGTAITSAMLASTATATPWVDLSADTVTTSSQLNTSAITGTSTVIYPAALPLFRYEGSTMAPSPAPNDGAGYVATGSKPPKGLTYRVSFTCDCHQFEYVVQSRGSTYRLWVNGRYLSPDSTTPENHYPMPNFVLVKFPDKRPRQIKLSLSGNPPFFGIVTGPADSVTAPQFPVDKRVMIFGDSWTGPTILQAAIPPLQDGLTGSGYPDVLGEYFNWDYWDNGVGGSGFTEPGTDPNGVDFAGRVLTDVCGQAPSAIVIMGGVNDGSATETLAQQDIALTLSELQNCLPGVPVYLYGPQDNDPTIEQAFHAAVANFTGVHYVDMGAGKWIYGTSNTSAADGNEYLYFNGHPTPLGHNFLAEKIAMDLQTAYPELTPAPLSLMTPAAVDGTFSYSTATGALLPAGSDAITASFTPTDAAHFAPAALEAIFTVQKATSTLAATTNGSTVTVTATPQIAGMPTGPVTVSEQGSPLATLTLATGVAAYDASALAPGTHTLSVAYGGDQNFLSSSTTATVQVAAPPVAPDFSVAASVSQLTIADGSTSSVSLVVTPVGGLAAALSLSCTGLPANASCAVASGSSATLGATASTIQVNILTTQAQSAALPGKTFALAGVFGAGLLAFAGVRRKQRWSIRTAGLGFVILAMATSALGGCSSGSGSMPAPPAATSTTAAPGTYSIQLVLTDTSNAAISHATPLTLVVQ